MRRSNLRQSRESIAMGSSTAPRASAWNYFRRNLGREALKWLVGRAFGWEAPDSQVPGYTIVVGVPWGLRHVLAANLEFLSRVRLTDAHEVMVVFDRTHRSEMDEIARAMVERFPQLPLKFRWYPERAGRLIQRANISTFYNSMNTVLAVSEARTRALILHDFDLYPLREDYFDRLCGDIVRKNLKFCGLEYTHYDGLSDSDRVLGTWALAMDAAWLRSSFKPTDCFHKIIRYKGRRMSLDPYSWVQLQVEDRDLVEGLPPESMCHIRNMCSTYLRFSNNQWAHIAWRLHSIWYLEHLSGDSKNLRECTRGMKSSQDGTLVLDGRTVDFSGTEHGAANVLRDEVERMDSFLYGEVRAEVAEYLDEFRSFLLRHGKPDPE